MIVRNPQAGLLCTLGLMLLGPGCNNAGITRQEVSGSVAKGQVFSSADAKPAGPASPNGGGTNGGGTNGGGTNGGGTNGGGTNGGGTNGGGTNGGGTNGGGTNGGGTNGGGTNGGGTNGGGTNGGGTNGTPGGTAVGTGDFSLLLDQCTAKKQAWPAVIGGQVWKTCGDNLVDWCCTRGDAKAQFPSLASELDRYFAQLIDTDRLTLYHCSSNPVGGPDGKARYTLHLGKVEGSTITYQTLTVVGVDPSGAPNSMSPCKVVRSPDIKLR